MRGRGRVWPLKATQIPFLLTLCDTWSTFIYVKRERRRERRREQHLWLQDVGHSSHWYQRQCCILLRLTPPSELCLLSHSVSLMPHSSVITLTFSYANGTQHGAKEISTNPRKGHFLGCLWKVCPFLLLTRIISMKTEPKPEIRIVLTAVYEPKEVFPIRESTRC